MEACNGEAYSLVIKAKSRDNTGMVRLARGVCFSWQFQDVLFHKGAPFLAWVPENVRVCVCPMSVYVSMRKCSCVYVTDVASYFRGVWTGFDLPSF